jgi:hypothetical protein
MRMITSAVFIVLLTACSTQPVQTTERTVYVPTPSMVEGTLVRCESLNNTRRTCRVDARTRMVAVNQQLSDNPCIVGRTWGVSNDRDEIWVDDGCRAEFQVGGMTVAGTAFGRSVICESQNNTRATCPVDTSYGVQLARQISRNDCVRGSDWGFTENGIWVDNGCRGEFVLGGEPRYQPMTSSTRQRIVCESQNNGRPAARPIRIGVSRWRARSATAPASAVVRGVLTPAESGSTAVAAQNSSSATKE